MEKETRKLEEELVVAIRKVELEAENILQQSAGSYQAILLVLSKLKEFITGYTFTSNEQEIKFFKHVKPSFLQQLIYNQEIYYLESRRPLGNPEAERNFLFGEQRRVQAFFERHRELHNYLKLGRTDLDHKYFLRSSNSIMDNPIYALDLDPLFSTVKSTEHSKLLAYEDLSQYLSRAILVVEQPEIAGKVFNSPLQWTDTKVALIELGYALFASGMVNHGKADIRQIMTVLEIMFNIDLGNYYNAFLRNILVRKKDPIVAIKKMTNALIDYIGNLLEYPKFS